jgi:hypothetical protein
MRAASADHRPRRDSTMKRLVVTVSGKWFAFAVAANLASNHALANSIERSVFLGESEPEVAEAMVLFNEAKSFRSIET